MNNNEHRDKMAAADTQTLRWSPPRDVQNAIIHGLYRANISVVPNCRIVAIQRHLIMYGLGVRINFRVSQGVLPTYRQPGYVTHILCSS